MVQINSSDLNEKLPKLSELLTGYEVSGNIEYGMTKAVSFNLVLEPKTYHQQLNGIQNLEQKFKNVGYVLTYVGPLKSLINDSAVESLCLDCVAYKK